MGVQKSDTIWQLNNNRQATLKTVCLETGNVMNSSSWKQIDFFNIYFLFIIIVSFIAFNSYFYIFYLYGPISYTWYTPYIEIMHVCSVAQMCPPLCDLVDCSPPGSSVHGITQASVLEWVAISFSRESSVPRDQSQVSYVSFTGRWILYHWATGEAPLRLYSFYIILVFLAVPFCNINRRVINFEGNTIQQPVTDWIGLEWTRHEWNQKMETLLQ